MLISDMTQDQLALALWELDWICNNSMYKDEGGSPTPDTFIYELKDLEDCTGISPDDDAEETFQNIDLAAIIKANPAG